MKSLNTQNNKIGYTYFELLNTPTRINWNNSRRYSNSTQHKFI